MHSRLCCEHVPFVVQKHQRWQGLHEEFAGPSRAVRMIHTHYFHFYIRMACCPLPNNGFLDFARLAPSGLEIEKLHAGTSLIMVRGFFGGVVDSTDRSKKGLGPETEKNETLVAFDCYALWFLASYGRPAASR